MVSIKTGKDIAELSNAEKGFKAPKYTFWAEDGYIHTVDEDTGHYWIKHWFKAEEALRLVMAVHDPNIQIAIHDSKGTDKHNIKEMFAFQKKLTEVIEKAKEQEAELYKRVDEKRKQGSSRIFVS